MAKYEVMVEYQLPKDAAWEYPGFGGALLKPGEYLYDGDIEPDLMAFLYSKGVLVKSEAPMPLDEELEEE